MKKYKLSSLSKTQLKRLRSDIILCSLYLKDYKNRYNLNPDQVCNFFDAYADYLLELMKTDNVTNDYDSMFFDLLPAYDNINNLYDFYCDCFFA